MAKKIYTSTTPIRIVAIVMIATVMILSLIGTGLYLALTPDIPAEASSTTSVTTPPPQESQPAPDVQENVPSIGIRDMSVSMASYMTAVAGYDTWSSFGQDGTSRITTAVVDALEKGYRKIGVVTDLESYPEGEMNAISGKHYKDIELTFFVPDAVDPGWLSRYSSTFMGALDSMNCSLKFVDMSGNTISVLYSNFKKVAEVPEPSVTTVTATTTTTTTLKEGNSVPLSLVIIVIEVLFLIVMGLIIAVMTRCCCGCNSCCCTCTPTQQPTTGNGVTRALQQSEALALDGSGSVENTYKKFIKWAESAGWSSVYRFASSVEEMKISRAKNIPAEGGTLGYATLKQLSDDGHKIVTIVSDMMFGDGPEVADGVEFDKIYFVGENLKEKSVERLTKFCKSYEIVSI